MQFNFQSDKPLYLQLAEGLEDAILSGAFPPDNQVPSTTEISVAYKINPATALKGVNLLVEEGVLYKKRGLGMFVSPGAAEAIIRKRRQAFYEAFVLPLVQEAEKLKIPIEETLNMIERGFEHEQN